MTAGSDNFADAPLLATVQNLTVHDAGSSAGATTEAGEPLRESTPNPIDRTRWLKFVPAVDGRFGYVAMPGSVGPSRWVTLYSGDGTLAGLTPQASGLFYNDFWLPFDYLMTAGQTYWLQVGTEVGDADSDYQLQLRFDRRIVVASEWVQGDDFTRGIGPLNISPGGRMLSDAQRNRYGAAADEAVPGGFSGGVLTAVENLALIRDQLGPGDGGVALHDSLMNVTYGHFEDSDESNYYAWSQSVAWYFSAWTQRQLPSVTIPGDYSAVEWEAPTCEIVGGTASLPALNGSYDVSTDPPSPVMSGEWFTKVTAVDNVEWTVPTTDDDLDYIVDHDMAVESGLPVGVWPSGRDTDPTVVTTTADVSDAIDAYGRVTLLIHLDSTTFDAPMPAEMTPNSTSFTFGMLLQDPVVEMTMRPPRHRFYRYDWAAYVETEAVLRQWPRSDGLGLSTAPRVWPPSAANGGDGLRVVGGYD